MIVQAQLIVDDDAAQIVDAAFHVVQPWRGTGKLIGGADVEHHKAVEIFDERIAIEVRGQQIGVAWFHPAVTAHVQVPAFLGGDDPNVFTLGFRAFTGTTGDAELHFVRGTDTFIAVFQFYAEADAIADAVAAPGTADAGFRHT